MQVAMNPRDVDSNLMLTVPVAMIKPTESSERLGAQRRRRAATQVIVRHHFDLNGPDRGPVERRRVVRQRCRSVWSPDEIGKSGLKALAAIGEVDLMKGRRLYQFVVAMFDCAARGGEFLPSDIPPAFSEAITKAARTLRESDEWCVAGLAACSIAPSRVRIGSPQGE